MTITNKEFVFELTSEGFTGYPENSDNTLSFDGGVGNPAGSLKSRCFGRNKTGVNNYWEWTGTWEDLGVTSGDTISQVRLNGADNRCTEWNVADAATIGPYAIYANDGTTLIATLWSGRSPTGSEGSWTSIGSQSYQSVASAYQASNTSIRVRLYNSMDNANDANAAISLQDDNFSIDIDHASSTDDLTATGITTTPVTGTPTASHIHDLSATAISTTPVLDTPTFASDSIYSIDNSDWFFSPGNWYKSGSTYAITNSPGAYTKLRFLGTGVKFTINLSLFQATGPGASDFPYFKWRTDGGSWQKQITTTGQTEFVFETGLSYTSHDIEIYFESVARNRDRWLNPSASIRIDNVTIEEGVIETPVLESERWLIFGDSRVEGVNTYGSSYSNADQGAARSFAILIGELQGAEVGAIGWVSQGFNWPSTGTSNIDEFHKYDETSKTWLEIFDTVSRSFTGIDTIIVNTGVNDQEYSESQLRTAISDFLSEVRTSAPSARIILLVPFFDPAYQSMDFGKVWTDEVINYVEGSSDNNCYVLTITGLNTTLDYDLSYQTPTTYSIDGAHPNQAGHDEIASLLDGVLDADNLLASYISTTPVLGTPTLAEGGEDNLTANSILTTPVLDTPELVEKDTIPAAADFKSHWEAISRGGTGEWDNILWSGGTKTIIKVGSTYYAYYVGAENEVSPDFRAIGLATSPDGNVWTKYAGNPIITWNPGGAGSPEESATSPVVIYDGSTWHMWYAAGTDVGGGLVDLAIRYRTSTDGITWTGDTLVYGPVGDEYYPTAAFKSGSTYYLYYIGSDVGSDFHYMYGTDPSALGNNTTIDNSGNFWYGRQFMNLATGNSPQRYLYFAMKLTGDANTLTRFWQIDTASPSSAPVQQTSYSIDQPGNFTGINLFKDSDNDRWIAIGFDGDAGSPYYYDLIEHATGPSPLYSSNVITIPVLDTPTLAIAGQDSLTATGISTTPILDTPTLGIPSSGISVNHLTDYDGSASPVVTSSISPTDGAVVYVFVAWAIGSGTATPTADGVSGCGLTWERLNSDADGLYGIRRWSAIYKGTGTPTSGSLTINYTPTTGTIVDVLVSVDEVLGLDPLDSEGTLFTNNSSGGSTNYNDQTISETADQGDFVMSWMAVEKAAQNMTIGINDLDTEHYIVENGSDVRSLGVAYGTDPELTNPDIGWTWDNAAYNRQFGLILNRAGVITGKFDIWLTNRIPFRVIPNPNISTGTFDKWLTADVNFDEYAALLDVSGGDNLTATGITSTPVLGTPSIGQIHALSATGITSTPVLDTPTLATEGEDNLTATGISSTPVLDTPSIGQIHALTATGITSTPVLDTPSIGQSHALAATGISSTPVLDTPSIGQIHALTATGITTTPIVDNPVLGTEGEDNLIANGIASTPVVDTPSIGQIHALSASGITTVPVLDTPTAAHIHDLLSTGIASTPVLDTPTATHIHNLVPTGLSTTPILDNPVLGSIGEDNLIANGITSTPVVDTPTVGQIHILTAISIVSTPIVDLPGIGQEHNLITIGITTIPVVDNPVLAHIYNFTATGILTTPILDTPTIGQEHTLSTLGISVTPVLGTPIIGSEGEDVLEALGITVTPILDTPSLGQIHELSATGVITTPEVNTPSITVIHNLDAIGMTTIPVVEAPELFEIHNLNATNITATPIIETPALGQIHALIGTGVLTTPEVDIPIFGQAHALIVVEISVTPEVGTSNIGQIHVLSSPGIVTQPELDTPAFIQTHILGSTGIETTPILGTPTTDKYLVQYPVDIEFSAIYPTADIEAIYPDIEFNVITEV